MYLIQIKFRFSYYLYKKVSTRIHFSKRNQSKTRTLAKNTQLLTHTLSRRRKIDFHFSLETETIFKSTHTFTLIHTTPKMQQRRLPNRGRDLHPQTRHPATIRDAKSRPSINPQISLFFFIQP